MLHTNRIAHQINRLCRRPMNPTICHWNDFSSTSLLVLTTRLPYSAFSSLLIYEFQWKYKMKYTFVSAYMMHTIPTITIYTDSDQYSAQNVAHIHMQRETITPLVKSKRNKCISASHWHLCILHFEYFSSPQSSLCVWYCNGCINKYYCDVIATIHTW